ncbi:TetR/AcrR family transcriptional regulator [Mediterraneibacter gnavus]|uniref:TetR/AcrR family transcriptional regulator n=1 Tax=Mediterraneibacter gnavus TaxID=33038 RepID=UPI00189FCC96|nr:TetR/AcrR family transcriptional regulator [Mediterraneibacter gnavus]
MQESKNVKEVIIDVTTELIQENNGNITKITSRKIAERAGVGLGLINYHFGSKDNLITICVQRIINNVVMCFAPDKKNYNEKDGLDDKERLADWAKQVYDFLFDNYAISKISILGDMQNYQAKSNSVYTQMGFSMAIRNDIGEENKKLLAFILTSTMQVAFLSGTSSKEILGYDLTIKSERDRYIDRLVEMLFLGVIDRREVRADEK